MKRLTMLGVGMVGAIMNLSAQDCQFSIAENNRSAVHVKNGEVYCATNGNIGSLQVDRGGILKICGDFHASVVANRGRIQVSSGGDFSHAVYTNAGFPFPNGQLITSVEQSCLTCNDPVIEATDASICLGESHTFDAGEHENVKWFFQGSLISTDRHLNTDESGNYTVEAYDGNCSSTKTISLTINSLPDISVNNNYAVCEGETFTISENSNYPVKWEKLINQGGGITWTTTSQQEATTYQNFDFIATGEEDVFLIQNLTTGEYLRPAGGLTTRYNGIVSEPIVEGDNTFLWVVKEGYYNGTKNIFSYNDQSLNMRISASSKDLGAKVVLDKFQETWSSSSWILGSTITGNPEGPNSLENHYSKIKLTDAEGISQQEGTVTFPATEYDGFYHVTVGPNENGCYNNKEVFVEAKQKSYAAINQTVCEGETVDLYGQVLSETGTYEATLTAANGCDSIVTLDFEVLPKSYTDLAESICEDETLDFNGQILSETGTYEATLMAANGCDSIVTLDLEVLPKSYTDLAQSICEDETLDFNGQILSETGTYEATLMAANGCDSIVTLDLEVLPKSYTDLAQSICQDETLEFNGQILSETGTYEATLMAANGCDSIVTLNLEVLPKSYTNLTESICVGEEFAFNEQTLTETGTYQSTLTAANGCDSIVTLDLTVNDLPQVNLPRETVLCGSSIVLDAGEGSFYSWSDENQTTTQTLQVNQEGYYSVTVENEFGCTNTGSTTVIKDFGTTVNQSCRASLKLQSAGVNYHMANGSCFGSIHVTEVVPGAGASNLFLENYNIDGSLTIDNNATLVIAGNVITDDPWWKTLIESNATVKVFGNWIIRGKVELKGNIVMMEGSRLILDGASILSQSGINISYLGSPDGFAYVDSRLNYSNSNLTSDPSLVSGSTFTSPFGRCTGGDLAPKMKSKATTAFEEGIAVFPNPTSDNLTIQSNESYEGRIIDLSGRIVKVFNTNEYNYQLNVSDLANGTYKLMLINETNIEVKSIVIKK